MKLSQQVLKKKQKTVPIYQQVADKHSTSYNYVAMIANGFRRPTKKKGLAILQELKQIANS